MAPTDGEDAGGGGIVIMMPCALVPRATSAYKTNTGSRRAVEVFIVVGFQGGPNTHGLAHGGMTSPLRKSLLASTRELFTHIRMSDDSQRYTCGRTDR